jgi:hypothetical protein
MAAPVIIRVGCAIDTSVEKTFGDIERRAVRAGKRVEQAMRPGRRRVLDDGFVQQAVAQEKRHTKAVEGESRQRQRAFRAEANARRAALRDEERALRDSIREHEKAERAKAKAAAASVREQARASRELDRFATRTSHRATRFFWPNAPLASMARRAGHDVMRGIGVDTTLSGQLQRVTGAESAAQKLSVLGYRPGEQGAAGQRQDPKKLADEARAAGEAFAMTTEEILAGQKVYADLLGNLEGARTITNDIAKIARSQGASFEDSMRVAGKLDSMYSNIPDYQNDQVKKNKAIIDQMRTLTYLAKVYSIPLETMADKIPVMTGVAGMFEGDVNQNLIELMTLMQLAEKGPGRNAAEAATMAGNIGKNLPKRADAMKEFAGVQLMNERGQTKGIQSLLLELFTKTEGGRTVKGKRYSQVELMHKVFPNIRQMGGIQESLTAFIQAGGGEAGREAVRKQFAPGKKATSAKQIDEDLALVLQTTEAKAAKFNQQLERIVATSAESLIPALEKLAPLALKGAEAMGRLVQLIAENPGKAIVGAIVASILRASLESTFRGAVEAVIMRAVSNVPTVPVPGGRPGVAPTGAGGGVGAAGPAAALAALGVGGALYELYALSGNRKGGANQVGADDWSLGSVVNAGWFGGITGAIGRKAGGGTWGEAAGELTPVKAFGWLRDFVNDPTGDKAADAQAKREATARQAEQARMAQATEAMRDKLGQTLNVRVTNADELRNPPPGGSGGNPDGREPPDA